VNRRCVCILLAVFLAGFVVAPRRASAQQADVIRGRVIGPDSLPVNEVLVTVTSFSGNVSRTARTNRDGRFTITFPSGDGDYMVAFAAIGYAAKRFEVKRMADEEILIADAKLTKVDAVLGAMNITAPRDKVARNDPAPDISGTERQLAAATAQVGVATAQLFPQVLLGGSAGLASRDSGDLFNGNTTENSSSYYLAGPAINWTVFDAGRRKAGVKLAKARVDAAKADYQDTVLRAFREVESSLVAVDRARASWLT
jgi:hypothetical protein